ncbi:hypothetical protein QQS21_011917 [Conoideocrella luteorostrata]|uniref:Uncharacterized protein n=1 Tax=Conoideocrella luteorostrata TaxID=1105319 RepID=A0AAJ0FN51_9HYPO|nr:hypothetical protein QQS21_011917 [Conoideocrella luteorostrata]
MAFCQPEAEREQRAMVTVLERAGDGGPKGGGASASFVLPKKEITSARIWTLPLLDELGDTHDVGYTKPVIDNYVYATSLVRV